MKKNKISLLEEEVLFYFVGKRFVFLTVLMVIQAMTLFGIILGIKDHPSKRYFTDKVYETVKVFVGYK